MIIYRKSLMGLALLWKCNGSALPRALIPAIFSSAVAVFFELYVSDVLLEALISHPYPFQVYCYITAFALVFRTNTAYARYWEARLACATMASKWGDAAAMALVFDHRVSEADACEAAAQAASPPVAHSSPLVGSLLGAWREPLDAGARLSSSSSSRAAPLHLRPPGPVSIPAEVSAQVAARRRFQALVLHRCSLLHALALQRLRRDAELEHLVPLGEGGAERAAREGGGDGRSSSATAEEEGSRASGCRRSTSSCDSLRRGSGGDDRSPVHTAWKRSLICVGLVRRARLPTVTLSVLGEVTEGEARSLSCSKDRVGLLYGRLCRLITERRCRGGMRGIDPPAVARIYQCLSEGMHGYHQARKVEDTPFPFPYAQMVTVMLALMVFVVPLVAVSKLGHDHHDGDPESSDIDRHFQQIAHGPWIEFWWRLLSPALGPALCFVTILCYYGLNEVARDLEEPFLYPPNDLPCSTFQDDLNLRLLASAQAACDGEAPFSGFDERTSRAEEEAEAQAAGALLEWVRAAAEPPSAGPSPCEHKPTPLDASQSLPQDDASARSDHPIAAALRRYTDYRSAGWEARRSNRNSILH